MMLSGVVTGELVRALETPGLSVGLEGLVRFTPTVAQFMYHDAENIVYIAEPIEVPLEDGKFNVALVSNQDPNVRQASPWRWRCSFEIIDSSIPSLELDVPPGSTQDISDLGVWQ